MTTETRSEGRVAVSWTTRRMERERGLERLWVGKATWEGQEAWWRI